MKTVPRSTFLNWKAAAMSIQQREQFTTATGLAQRLEQEDLPEGWAAEVAEAVWEELDSIGPFRPEPAPDPHAAAMAAGMSAVEKALHPDPENPSEPAMCRWCDRPAVILNSVCGKPACLFHEDDATPPHPLPYYVIRRQRDELADALEACRGLFDGWGMIRENLGVKGRAQYDALVSLIDNALRKAGRS